MDLLIKKALERNKGVLANVKPSQYDGRTPCDEYDVRTLANHMTGFLHQAEAAASKRAPAPSNGEAPDFVGNNPGAAYAPLADRAAAAWSAKGALEGETDFGFGKMPAQGAAALTLMELVVHGWDLATATGQKYDIAPDVAEATWQAVQAIATPEARQRGTFAAEVKVTVDAPLKDRIVAYAGRKPDWKA